MQYESKLFNTARCLLHILKNSKSMNRHFCAAYQNCKKKKKIEKKRKKCNPSIRILLLGNAPNSVQGGMTDSQGYKQTHGNVH